MRRTTSFLLGFLSVASLAYATHGHWIDHYTNAYGASCCQAQKDCVKVKARILEPGELWTWVEVDGEKYRMDTASIHISEDMRDWFCRWVYAPPKGDGWTSPICLFIAPGA